MLNNPEEKRRFPRINLRSPIRWQVRGLPEFDNAICEDVSIGGVSFISPKFITPSKMLMLEINVLSRVLHPIGRIAWSNPLAHSDRIKMGVEFLEIPPKEKEYLNDFITLQQDVFYERKL